PDLVERLGVARVHGDHGALDTRLVHLPQQVGQRGGLEDLLLTLEVVARHADQELGPVAGEPDGDVEPAVDRRRAGGTHVSAAPQGSTRWSPDEPGAARWSRARTGRTARAAS